MACFCPIPHGGAAIRTAGGAELDRGGSRDAKRCAAPGQPLGGDAALRPPRGGGTPAPRPAGVPRSAGARGVVRAAAARMELCPRGQDRRPARGGVFGAASRAREPDRDLPAGFVRGGADDPRGREGRSPPLPSAGGVAGGRARTGASRRAGRGRRQLRADRRGQPGRDPVPDRGALVRAAVPPRLRAGRSGRGDRPRPRARRRRRRASRAGDDGGAGRPRPHHLRAPRRAGGPAPSHRRRARRLGRHLPRRGEDRARRPHPFASRRGRPLRPRDRARGSAPFRRDARMPRAFRRRRARPGA